MFDDIDFDINPIAFLYGGAGLIIGLLMMKYGSTNVGPVWKILTVVGTTVAAFILGWATNRD